MLKDHPFTPTLAHCRDQPVPELPLGRGVPVLHVYSKGGAQFQMGNLALLWEFIKGWLPDSITKLK